MITTNLLQPTEARKITDQKGIFSVIEYERDLSIEPNYAEVAYYASKMDVRKRQLAASLNGEEGVITQRGILQLMLGDLSAKTDVSGIGDYVKKIVGSKVTGETAVKPLYTGEGMLVLEPTFRHIILEDLADWNNSIVIEDGMFLACESSATLHVSPRTNVSSTVLGGEGLFNTSIRGSGVIALESSVPRSELVEVCLENDVLKIDGNMAIAWTSELDFTIERTTPTLVGSVAAGEGFVNVYRGTGKVLIAPVFNNIGISIPKKGK